MPFSPTDLAAVLLPMPVSLCPVAETPCPAGDIAIIGFFFVGVTVFFRVAMSARDRLDAAAVLGAWPRQN